MKVAQGRLAADGSDCGCSMPDRPATKSSRAVGTTRSSPSKRGLGGTHCRANGSAVQCERPKTYARARTSGSPGIDNQQKSSPFTLTVTAASRASPRPILETLMASGPAPKGRGCDRPGSRMRAVQVRLVGCVVGPVWLSPWPRLSGSIRKLQQLWTIQKTTLLRSWSVRRRLPTLGVRGTWMPAVVYQRVTWLSLGKSWEKHPSEWQPRGLRSSLEKTIVRCICIVQEIEVIYGHSMEGLLITVCHARDDGSCV